MSVETVPEALREGSAPVLLLKLPPIVGLAVIVAVLTAEWSGYRGHAEPRSNTLSEAAASGEAARAVELLIRGQDPNRVWPVAANVLSHATYELLPIDAAILSRRIQMVALMQRHGAKTANPVGSACLARAIGLPEAQAFIGAPQAGNEDSKVVGPEDAVQQCHEGAVIAE
ncbi:MAG: hypothetical protein ABMA15_13050 [Vicinamibacterales bacterium]